MTKRTEYVLGVDGGNTKTIALVARLDGTIVGSARGGCGDIYDLYNGQPSKSRTEAALCTIASTVSEALQGANIAHGNLLASGLSLAGADWPEDIAFLQDSMGRRGLRRHIAVVNDAIGALWAGSPDSSGVAVVCGTGGAVGSRAPNGRQWHGSFWLEPFGAEVFAELALRAIYRSELGLGPPTSLRHRALEAFGCDSVEDLLHSLTARDRPPRQDRGNLVAALLDEADSGDDVALSIVHAEAARIGDYALLAARRVGLGTQQFNLVLSGGVLRHRTPMLTEAIVARVRRSEPGVRPLRSRLEPAAGALLLAFAAAGLEPSTEARARVEATLPPAVFFLTHDAAACQKSSRPYAQMEQGGEL
jgi:N-acetylglucosamine kinase-like BadF-type ATPase